jgi:hypothetical protein
VSAGVFFGDPLNYVFDVGVVERVARVAVFGRKHGHQAYIPHIGGRIRA